MTPRRELQRQGLVGGVDIDSGDGVRPLAAEDADTVMGVGGQVGRAKARRLPVRQRGALVPRLDRNDQIPVGQQSAALFLKVAHGRSPFQVR